MSIKTLKQELKKKTDKNPEKYYAINVLKSEGYSRKKCKGCGIYFWTLNNDDVCGEPECSGGYKFIGNPPTKQKMDFIGVWKSFSSFFKKQGYTPIKRYPTAARWRDDTDFVQASIYDFQPYVVSGEIEPPANPLVVPQYCVRFNSIESVGLTGRHNTGFVMIGQHAFDPPNKFDVNRYFKDLYSWFIKEVKIPKQEMKFHESQWAGGGNLGVCMEMFSRGLEIANQVYMYYGITPKGYEDLKIKVLDMGMGQDRPAWLSTGNHSIYEIDYPEVCEKLYKITGYKPTDVFNRFVPYGSILDVDSDIKMEKAWQDISKSMQMDLDELQKQVLPLTGIYSIADHSQTILVALADGTLPSNMGGGYNLRVILRRALSFIDEYAWKISLPTLCEWHAKYLKPMYPELVDSLDEVTEILEFEAKKYKATLKRTKQKISNILEKQKKFDFSVLTTLYESDGITPELIKEVATKMQKKVELPSDFYKKMTEKHVATKKEEIKEWIDVSDLPKTEVLYYEDVFEFNAKVLKEIDKAGKHYVVLDRTGFYPESGGQSYDQGSLDGVEVINVQKAGNVIVHEVDKKLGKKEVKGKVDISRRKQLIKHHTATHVVNGAARRVLGNHVWQAGSEKTVEKARLDISHYDVLTEEQMEKIEKLANKAVKERRKVIISEMPRNEAEERYGFRLYQGGAVPSKTIRVVDVKDWDVEACGGLHVKNTSELEIIKLVRSKKKQDGVIRLEYVAGKDLVKKVSAQIEKERKEQKEIYERKKKAFEEKKRKVKEVSKAVVIPKESVMFKDTEDMRELQAIGRTIVKQDPKRSIILVGKGIVAGFKGKDSKADVEKVVKKAAEIMGGKIGGKGNEFKGGGPLKDKSKQAYEEIKGMI